MKARKLYYLILLGIASACSGLGEDTETFLESRAQHRSITFLSEQQVGYSVTAFREQNGGYYFQNQFKDGWSADGKLNVQLPVGNYKFLFASSYGANTLLLPELQLAGTSFDDMVFSVKPDNNPDGTLRAGDELFLQDHHADSVYRLTTASTIRCTLKRAVSQIRLVVKRGRLTGTDKYEPLPYPTNDDITRYISKVRIDIAGTAATVDARGIYGGSGNISFDIPAIQKDSITHDGFAAFTGPFFFPGTGGQPLDFTITLYRSGNSPQPETLALRASRAVVRNQQLVVTAWIASDWNFIGVTTDTLPITKEINGEQDIWDDNVQQL